MALTDGRTGHGNTNRREAGIGPALPLLAPAYLWLTVAIFLPLSAMVFFSFMTDLPLSGKAWSLTLHNYAAFFSSGLYLTLLLSSLRLGLEVTLWCAVIGFPAAYVLAKVLKGRAREAIFLLVILPFWSNGLVRIFSWAMVLREGGILDTALNAVLPFRISIDLMYSYPAVIIGLVHSYVPYMVLTCYLTLQAIDDSLIEAARSLGATRLQTLRRVIVPLAMPGLVAGAVLIFVPVVGSFMEPRILGGRTGTFYGTVIEDQFVAVFNWPLGAALSFILLAVVLVILAVAVAGAAGGPPDVDHPHARRARPPLHRPAARLPLSADRHHGADVVQRLALLPAAVRVDDEWYADLSRNDAAARRDLEQRRDRRHHHHHLRRCSARLLRWRFSATSSAARSCCRRCCSRRSPFRG